MNIKTILVVDDDPFILALTKELLFRNGFAYLQAKDGQEALKMLETNSVDLIVLDRNMPEVQGMEVLKHLRATPKTAKIPVIMMTSDSEMEQVSESIEAGVQDYIVKPVDKQKLITRINKVLQKTAIKKPVKQTVS